MTKINDGGPAFPTYSVLSHCDEGGMSLRDYFAAKAMQVAVVNARLPGLDDGDPDAITLLSKACEVVYIVADAMLKARENNT